MSRMSYNPYDVLAIAVAMRDARSGRMTIWGSRRVYRVELSMDVGYHGDTLWGERYRSYIPSHQSFRIAADCGDMQMHQAEPMAEQPHLTQRGIYLPDMSFRALPAPSEGEDARS